LAAVDAGALLEIADCLRMRTGQFVVTFGLLEEIAVRQDTAIGAILARPEIRRIIEGRGSAPARGRALIEALRALRFPQLHEYWSGLTAAVAALRLPAGIHIGLPSNLSSDELRIEIVAREGEELRQLIDALFLARNKLCRIADALGGDDV
jgi:hypothetical protein